MKKFLVGAVVVCAVVAGVIFFVRPLMNQPPAATQPQPTQPQPTQPQQPQQPQPTQPQPTQPTPAQPQPTQPQPPIPSNFIVEDRMWRNATFVHSTVQGGAIIPRLIGFNVPTGTKIFAPRSGYIHVMHRRPDEIHPEKITISILDTPDRTVIPPMGRRITLITLEFDFVIQELMGARAPFVERGTLLGTVANNSSMYPTLIEEEVNLMLEIGPELELSPFVDNPKIYVWDTLQRGGK